MKAGTQNHLKTKRLKRILGIPLYRVVGILEGLWLLCTDCCDEGNIGKFTDEEIADYLEWDGKPSELVRALTDSGWFDVDPDDRLVVHDWLEHCPEFIRDRVRKREARGSKARKQKTYEQSKPDTNGQDRTDAVVSGACPTLSESVPSIPNPFQPIQSQPNPTHSLPQPAVAGESAPEGSLESSEPPKRKPAQPYTSSFETWFTAYPRKVGKDQAATAYVKAVKKVMATQQLEADPAREYLLSRTQHFARTPAGRAGHFVPYPATWLNAGHYNDDPEEWSRDRDNNPTPAKNSADYRPGKLPGFGSSSNR